MEQEQLMTRVLAAIDGSPVSERVICLARTLAAIVHADVEALYVGTHSAPAERFTRLSGTRLLVRPGDPKGVIAEEFDRGDVVFGVIGARAAAGRAQPAGHLACDLVRRCMTPLVVVPPDVELPEHTPFGPVLVSLEGIDEPSAAVVDAVGMLSARGLDVVGVHVLHDASRPLFWDRPRYESADWRDEFRRRFCHRRSDRLIVRSGLPGDVVVEVAREVGAGLVVLDWSHDLGPGRAATVRHVLADSPCALLLISSAAPDIPGGRRLRPSWSVDWSAV
jgi:nucleotide-binding universal stress UspA family protein